MQHYQVTLTTQDVAYNLLTLVKTQNSSFKDIGKQITIQSDDGNSAAIFLGGPSTVTTAVYGVKLPNANDSINLNDYPVLAGIWAVSGSDSQKLNISVF